MSNMLVPFAAQTMSGFGEEAATDPLAIHLQQVVQKTYQWADAKYKTEALEHLQGMAIAYQCGLATQVELYQHKIKELVARDIVMQATTRMPKHNWYGGFIYAHPLERAWMLSQPEFVVGLTLPAELATTWRFSRIENFRQLVPPMALHVLAALGQVGLTLDDFWVAEKQRSIDPILFAQFGYTFVALAAWE